MENKCKLLHERTKRKCAIIEVTSTIYKHVKDNKIRLFVGHRSCRVFDIINTTPCNELYARFEHSSKKGENQATCNKYGCTLTIKVYTQSPFILSERASLVTVIHNIFNCFMISYVY